MTESDNADLFEAEGKSILQFLNVFITICGFKEDLQIAKKLNLSSRNVQKLHFFFKSHVCFLALVRDTKADRRCIYYNRS